MRFRTLENHVYRLLRDPAAATIAERPTTPWQPSALAGETYCLLTSFRAGGAPVATPVWFAVDAERVYLRSERRDAKVARVRRNPEVLVAACNARGRPTGPPMRGRARVLQTAQEEAKAEHALRSSHGVARRLYGVLRAPWLDAAYIEVRPPEPDRRHPLS